MCWGTTSTNIIFHYDANKCLENGADWTNFEDCMTSVVCKARIEHVKGFLEKHINQFLWQESKAVRHTKLIFMKIFFCNIGSCDSLSSSISNGTVEHNDTTATYTCNNRYMILGSSSRQCQDNGEWSGDAPSCESNE